MGRRANLIARSKLRHLLMWGIMCSRLLLQNWIKCLFNLKGQSPMTWSLISCLLVTPRETRPPNKRVSRLKFKVSKYLRSIYSLLNYEERTVMMERRPTVKMRQMNWRWRTIICLTKTKNKKNNQINSFRNCVVTLNSMKTLKCRKLPSLQRLKQHPNLRGLRLWELY